MKGMEADAAASLTAAGTWSSESLSRHILRTEIAVSWRPWEPLLVSLEGSEVDVGKPNTFRNEKLFDKTYI